MNKATQDGTRRSVTDHLGQPRSKGQKFFANPSPEIGQVLSAESSFPKGGKPPSRKDRVTTSITVAVVGVVVGICIVLFQDAPGAFGQIAWPLGVGAAGYGLGWLFSERTAACTFVGEQGIHMIQASMDFEAPERNDVLLFADADVLRTGITKHYTNGAYTNTNFDFGWHDESGRRLFHLYGTHSDEQGNPTDIIWGSTCYRFCRAAERVWSAVLLGRANESLKRVGYVEFPLAGSDWVRIGKDSIEFSRKGKQARFESADIASVKLIEGKWTIKPTGARKGLFGPGGTYTFEHSTLGNAELFVICLDKLLGFGFG